MKKPYVYVVIGVGVFVLLVALVILGAVFAPKSSAKASNDDLMLVAPIAEADASIPAQVEATATYTPRDVPAVGSDQAGDVYSVLAMAPADELWIVTDGWGYVASPTLIVNDADFTSNGTVPAYVAVVLSEGGTYPASCVKVASESFGQFTVFSCKKLNLDN